MKNTIDFASIVQPSDGGGFKSSCDDRVGEIDFGSYSLHYLADGATGIGYGGKAADAFVDYVRSGVDEDFSSESRCLSAMFTADMVVSDALNGDGDTTGILLATDGSRFWGAFAGDSRVFLYSGGDSREITSRKFVKPRLGSGAFPGSFSGEVNSGDVLVVGSDGLWNYTYGDSVRQLVDSSESASAFCQELPGLVRRANRSILRDDLSCVVLCF